MSVTLADKPANGCSWPVAMRDGQHLFCGCARATRNVSYCAEHMRRAYPSARKPDGTLVALAALVAKRARASAQALSPNDARELGIPPPPSELAA